MRNKDAEISFLQVSIGVLVTAVVCLYVGIQFSFPVLTGMGLLILGLNLTLKGLEDLQQEEVHDAKSGTEEMVQGVARRAVAPGLFSCGAGIAFATAGLAFTSGHAEIWWAYFKDHPGLLCILGGFETFTFGLYCLPGSEQGYTGISRLIGSLFQRIIGTVLLAAGFLAILSGILNIFLPGIYQILIVGFF